jgi:hypothetical protein
MQDRIQNGIPEMGSTLPGLASIIEKASKGQYKAPPVPVRTAAPVDQFHQPFNSDMEDKLKAFFANKDKDNAPN